MNKILSCLLVHQKSVWGWSAFNSVCCTDKYFSILCKSKKKTNNYCSSAIYNQSNSRVIHLWKQSHGLFPIRPTRWFKVLNQTTTKGESETVQWGATTTSLQMKQMKQRFAHRCSDSEYSQGESSVLFYNLSGVLGGQIVWTLISLPLE